MTAANLQLRILGTQDLTRLANLYVGVNFDVAGLAHLGSVRPAVSAHPLSTALGTLILAEAPPLSLIRCLSWFFGLALGRYRTQEWRVIATKSKMNLLGNGRTLVRGW